MKNDIPNFAKVNLFLRICIKILQKVLLQPVLELFPLCVALPQCQYVLASTVVHRGGGGICAKTAKQCGLFYLFLFL
jgi:hypothetical protein